LTSNISGVDRLGLPAESGLLKIQSPVAFPAAGLVLRGYISFRLDLRLAREPLNIVLAKQHSAVERLSSDAQSAGLNKTKDAQGWLVQAPRRLVQGHQHRKLAHA
jgi:hypothetical protein